LSRYTELLEKIKKKQAVVSVIGLGYIGLPTALFYARSNLILHGTDTNEVLVSDLKQGKIAMLEEGLEEIARNYLMKIDLHTNYEQLGDSDVCVLCLPSPLDEKGKPNTAYLEDSISNLAKILKKGPLIIVESTIAVGTTEMLSRMFAEKSGLKEDKEFWFAHCPERVLPGKIVQEMDENHRLAGGISTRSTEITVEFLKSVFRPDLIHPTSARISETAKLAENAFRDTNIAFANELARISDALGVDVNEVIRFANLHPRVEILNPGLGVGGYCLPKDGWILVESAREKGFDSKLIPAARAVNDSMPEHVMRRIQKTMKDRNLESTTVGLLGLSFKANVSDTRNSPTLQLMSFLKEEEISYVVYDPLVENDFGSTKLNSMNEILSGCKIIVLCVGHKIILEELQRADLSKIILVDPRYELKRLKSEVEYYIGLSS